MSKSIKENETKFKIADLIDAEKKENEKLENFKTVLNKLTAIDEKKKTLWLEIYENALEDRTRAAYLFDGCLASMSTGTNSSIAEHATIGTTMSKYIERLTKCNDQILQLVNMILKAEQDSIETNVNYEELFDQIQG
jgi:ABC-type Fe3+-citrate transport system substrate-binding protein